MPDPIVDRLKRVAQHEEKKKNEAEQRRLKQEEAAKAAAEIRQRAPTLWKERWKTFQEQREKINRELEPLGLALDLVSHSGPAQGNLADFGIHLHDNGQRMDHHMRCVVNAAGGISLTRRLPSLMDSKHVGQEGLTEAKIADLLLRFVENARGMRSMQQMLAD